MARQQVVLEHTLPRNPLFGMAALAGLIETLPRENYVLMHTGPVGSDKKLWEEGEIGDLSGEDVIEAIRRGNLLAAHTSCGRCQRSDVSSAARHL